MSEKRQPIGMIGVGLMGAACASRLQGSGFDVLCYDVDAEKRAQVEQNGARVAASIAEIARTCRKIVLAVFNTEQVEDVIEGPHGLLQSAPTGGPPILAICISTCDPDRIAALAARLPPERLRYVESPISGSSAQTASGDAYSLVGGDATAVEEARDVLEAMTPRWRHLGAAGNGGRAKLAINLILGINRGALAEGLVFAERMGLDPATFLQVAHESSAHSKAMDLKGAKMVRGDFTPQGFAAQSLKDFTLMGEVAQRIGQRLPLAETNAALMKGCVENGEGNLDNAVVINEIRRRRT